MDISLRCRSLMAIDFGKKLVYLNSLKKFHPVVTIFKPFLNTIAFTLAGLSFYDMMADLSEWHHVYYLMIIFLSCVLVTKLSNLFWCHGQTQVLTGYHFSLVGISLEEGKYFDHTWSSFTWKAQVLSVVETLSSSWESPPFVNLD